MEWLAGRNLIKSLMHDDVHKTGDHQNASGKPIEHSDECVSISHSEKVANNCFIWKSLSRYRYPTYFA